MGVPSGDEEAGGSRGHSATLSLGRILVSGPVQLPLFFAKDTNETYPDSRNSLDQSVMNIFEYLNIKIF